MAADITESVPQAPWWGWAAAGAGLPEGAARVLRARLGAEIGEPVAPAALDEVELPEPELTAAALEALAGAAGHAAVSQRASDRLRHAAGKHTPDLLRQRAGRPLAAPDAVVTPDTEAAVAAILGVCAAHDIAVVPFGGGTSVVGGVAPLRGGHAAVIALDLGRLDALIALDETDRTATFEAGIRGPALERALAARGFTLGHLPQSHQQATLGGYAATRSAGQASTGYGAIAELITGIRIETPSGRLDLGGRAPASAAGPDLRQLVIGSEGAFGVITRVTVAIRRAPTRKAYGSWAFPSFDAGAAAVRALAQDGGRGDLPEVCRLSDEEETELTLAQSDSGATRTLRRWLGLRGIDTPALLLGVWEGTDGEVRRRRSRAARILRSHGGVPTTERPAAAWDAGRFGAPRLRDELLAVGVMVDTLETAATWSELPETHRAVAEAIRGALAAGPATTGSGAAGSGSGANAGTAAGSAGAPSAVQGHISHMYRDGASLYYTFIAAAEADPIAQYERVKAAANAAILARGATITHHHAVGTEHAALLPAEIGPLGVRALRAVKAELDPAGIMNPGKLLGAPAAANAAAAGGATEPAPEPAPGNPVLDSSPSAASNG
ncbi:FAD-binding oxidoreductase [Leucobacter luti]|uniref:Alkyldihydroxyacetonephosphate synthase n=1 Tax=Leucobacter luti TaxID=340320 RepID=A0A4V6MDQ1_9MICO|nr:FAD-binding oxidoreductase [Leucobacter luti]MBL3700930.1 FAD-binding oxidoreductase [Leucobacter luti]RZT68849.1 alkyldihydroxyacetonephosphate synthase [Leucobacter luti]